jgi:hypothetical protein
VRQELLAQSLQQNGFPRHRSSNGRTMPFPPLSFERDGSRRLVRSSGCRKTCPAREERTPKDLCGGRGRSGSHRASPWPPLARLGGTPLVKAPVQ